MASGGLRPILLSALIATTLLVPISATAQTCVSPGLFELCTQSPGTMDAGEASAIDGDVTATASGGIVPGLGSAAFVVDYQVSHAALASGETLFYTVSVAVYDGEGDIVTSGVATGELDETVTSVQDEVRARVDTVAPLVDEGTVRVTMDARLSTTSGFERLGYAVSYAPVTLVLGPPADVASRTEVAQTVDVGSFEAGPNAASADAMNGSLLVAQGTSVRLEASGVLAWTGTSGADRLTEQADARLSVHYERGFVSASAIAVDVSCFTGPCDLAAGSTPVELSVVIPGEATEPLSDLTVQVSADWNHYARTGTTTESDSARPYDLGQNALVALGA